MGWWNRKTCGVFGVLKCTQGLLSFLSNFILLNYSSDILLNFSSDIFLNFSSDILLNYCSGILLHSPNPSKAGTFKSWDMPDKNRITSSTQRGWAGTEKSHCLIIKSIQQPGRGVRTLRKIHPNSSAAIREVLQALGRDNKMGITAESI